MEARLESYTAQLENCRRRWNRHSLEFVLESARILSAARAAAKSEHRWMVWLCESAHMSRMTASRHLAVARFIQHDVTLRRHCANLSISKVYALSRTKPIVAHRLLEDEKFRNMGDPEFHKFIRRLLPKSGRRPTIPNMLRSIMAGLDRAGRGIARWKGSRSAIPAEYQSRIQQKLNGLSSAVAHLRTYRRRAL